MTDRERAQAYLDLAIKADGKEITWHELECASIIEGPWLAERLLETLEQLADRDKTIRELLHAKARLADTNLELEYKNAIMLETLQDALDMCDDYTQFDGDGYSMIGRHLRDTLAKVKGGETECAKQN
jgi:hypothetical protein